MLVSALLLGGAAFCCEGDGPWLMMQFNLSCFLRIGMANGCTYKLIGDGRMILLSGISVLGIFGHLRLLHMPGTL